LGTTPSRSRSITAVLAAATVILAVLTYAGIRSARADAANEVEAMRKVANDQITATQQAAAAQVQAAQDAAERQVAAARKQLDAEHRPFLIEVLRDGPVFPDMGARENPDIARGSASRQIPRTITVVFDNARPPEEIDPRHLLVRLERGMIFVSVPLRNVGRGLAIIDEGSVRLRGSPGVGAAKAIPTARPRQVPAGETMRVQVITGFPAGAPAMTQDDRWQLIVPYRDYAWEQPAQVEVLLGYRGEHAGTGEWYVTSVCNQDDAASHMA
jgi:hypothetical protein